MIDAKQFAKQVSEISKLIEAGYGVSAPTFERQVARLGRRLPKAEQVRAKVLITAQRQMGHPKLMLQVNGALVARAHEDLVVFLKTLDRSDRRKGAVLGVLGSIGFSLLVVFALFVLVLIWRGFV